MTAGARCPACGRESEGLCRRCLLEGVLDEGSERFELPGELEGFRPLKRIGHGASGEVWEAFQPGPDRKVALKVFLDPRLGGRADRPRFMAEAQSLGKLDHPGIVPVYAAGEEAGFWFIASRWMRGGTLERVKPAEREGCRDARRVAGLISKIARAVEHAHRHGLVHRERILALAFAPDGRTLVSSSYDRTLRLWHRPTWRRLGVLERGATANYLGFDRSGGRLVSGSHHRPVSVFPKEAVGDRSGAPGRGGAGRRDTPTP